MGVFIKITDVNEKSHYLNTDYIVKFMSAKDNSSGHTVIQTTTEFVYTSTTPEEIIDIIDLARN